MMKRCLRGRPTASLPIITQTGGVSFRRNFTGKPDHGNSTSPQTQTPQRISLGPRQVRVPRMIRRDRKPASRDVYASRAIRGGYTWLTKDPSLVDLKPLLKLTSQYDPRKPPVKTVIVLATPSLASVLEQKDFLRPLLEGLWKGRRSRGGEPVRELAVSCVHAVVDALPVSSSLSASHGGPPGVTAGEGFAILLSNASKSHAISYTWRPSRVDSQGEVATLTFGSTTDPIDVDPGRRPNRVLARRITLPTANTIFVNGQRKTLFKTTWKVELSQTKEPVISYASTEALDSYSINFPCSVDEFIKGGSSPLQRLTEPRKIIRSMGNVLAQIEINGEGFPASHELEKAVSSYITSNPENAARGPLLVYALIHPGNTYRQHKGVEDGHQKAPSSGLEALWQGAKLFRVTGGGGGWGKRQGLLSLEAAVDFGPGETEKTIDMPDLDDDQSVESKFGSHGIISDSDMVEFLVYSPNPTAFDQPNDHARKYDPSVNEQDVTQIVLGTAANPDAGDEIVRRSGVDDRAVQFVPGYFGMISYAGAALSAVIVPLEPSRSKMVDRVKTRLDVPDSHFVFPATGHSNKSTELNV